MCMHAKNVYDLFVTRRANEKFDVCLYVDDRFESILFTAFTYEGAVSAINYIVDDGEFPISDVIIDPNCFSVCA